MVAAELKPVYLLSGSDRPKIARALSRLRAHFPADAIEHLLAESVSGADAVAACNSLGLLAGGRLVVVDGVDGRRNADGRPVGGWKAADVEAVAAYLAAPAPETVLALVGEEAGKDSALGKICEKVGELLHWDVAKRRLPEWVAEQFRVAGAQADADACRALVELVGERPERLASEVDKIATWARGEEITERDVHALVADWAEVPYFALSDAWGRRDVPAVLAACESILERGHPRDRSLLGLTARLAAHVGRVRECQALDAEGVRPRDAGSRLKMHPFAAEKAFTQSRNFAVDELRGAVVRLARLDLALKGGSRLPAELELERALVEITRRPEPPGRQEAAA